MAELPAFADDVWELYAPGRLDPGQRPRRRRCPRSSTSSRSCSSSRPAGTTCCPWTTAASSASTPRSPAARELIPGRTQILYGGMGRLTEATVLNIKNVSHAVAADVEIPDGGASGVIVVPGRRLRRMEPLPARRRHARLLLQPDGHAGPPRSSVPSRWQPGRRRVVMVVRLRRWRTRPRRRRDPHRSTARPSPRAGSSATVPLVFSLDETCDVGHDSGSPVSDDYRSEDSAVHRHRRLRAASRSPREQPTSATWSTRNCACPRRWPASNPTSVAVPRAPQAVVHPRSPSVRGTRRGARPSRHRSHPAISALGEQKPRTWSRVPRSLRRR